MHDHTPDERVCGCGLLRKPTDKAVEDCGFIYCHDDCRKKHRKGGAAAACHHYYMRDALHGDAA